MTNSKTIEALLQLPKYTKGKGLHRMNYLTKDLQNTKWWKTVDPINVVGTDGKGSTVTMIAAILNELEVDYGKYTSPHLFKFNERIEINERAISDSALERLVEDIDLLKAKFLDLFPEEQFNAFETFTAIAIRHFFANDVQAVILEAGIGGRYDSTRVFTGSLAALTSVGLEHTEILGKSLEVIAFDKMDILNKGGTLIVGKVPDDLLLRIKYYASVKNIKIIAVQEECKIEWYGYEDNQMILTIKVEDLWFEELRCNLIGKHQISNIQVAILLVKKWLERNYPEISKEQLSQAIYKRLPNLTWEGRFEKVHYQPSIYIDVGHTFQAFEALLKTLKELKKDNIIWVVGFSKNRDIQKMLDIIYPIASEIICTEAYHRSASTNDVFENAKSINHQNIPIYKKSTVEAAIDFAKERAISRNQEILVLGSLFLAIETFYYLNGHSPKMLSFF